MRENHSKQKKALVVATVGRFLTFEKNDIHLLQSMGYEVHCAANLELEESDRMEDFDVVKHHIDTVRSPFSIHTLWAYRQLRKLLKQESFELIHCHTPVAGILTRLAAGKYRKKGTVVIYTAHGFHFYDGAPLKNWLMFYPVEKLCSYRTDILITINQEDYRRAGRHLHAKKTFYVPGVGIDIKRFRPDQRMPEITKPMLGVPETAVMLLSVGELNENKNHVTVIKALADLPESVHYVIAGSGDRADKLKETAEELGVADRLHLLGQRTDVPELLRCADVFLLPSIREGLNVSLMEAMASGLPCICSDIRGNEDLIEEEKGGCRVASTDAAAWSAAIQKILTDTDGRIRMGKHNRMAIQRFSLEAVEKRMMKIYSSECQNLLRSNTCAENNSAL